MQLIAEYARIASACTDSASMSLFRGGRGALARFRSPSEDAIGMRGMFAFAGTDS